MTSRMSQFSGLFGLGFLCLALPQSDVAVEPQGVESLSAGLEEIESLCASEDFDGARARGEQLLSPTLFASWRRSLELDGSRVLAPTLEFAEPVIDFLRLSGNTEEERAHLHFALGVVENLAEDPEASKREFESARNHAGEGGLRLDAAYNLGTVTIAQGEVWRSQIPELGGQPPQPAPQAPGTAPALPGTPGAGAPAAAPEEPPDPLEEARKKYLEAREHLIVRLALDWSDADSRANMELVMRRLRELDEIERQREEQQQENQDQQDQQDQEQEDQENQDSEDQEGDNQESQDQEGEDQEQEPEESQPEGEDEAQEEPEPEPEPEEQEQESEQQQSGEEEAEEEEESQAGQEIFLTKEEVQRLLDKLKQHEEQGEEIRARARSQRQRPTPRDW